MVELGTNQSEWDAWFEATGDQLARRALIPAHGNHEFLALHYFAQWSLPNNEQWFNVRYGNLQVVVTNDTVSSRESIETVQPAYMDSVFSASDARWKMVVHHRPAYSTCTRHGSADDLREAWSPVFERTGVDLVVAGHNHLYERSVPIRGDQEVGAGEGPIYLVSGGAGAELYEESEDNWFGVVADPVVHYVIGDFGPDGAEFVVRDLAGNVVDRFSLASE